MRRTNFLVMFALCLNVSWTLSTVATFIYFSMRLLKPTALVWRFLGFVVALSSRVLALAWTTTSKSIV